MDGNAWAPPDTEALCQTPPPSVARDAQSFLRFGRESLLKAYEKVVWECHASNWGLWG